MGNKRITERELLERLAVTEWRLGMTKGDWLLVGSAMYGAGEMARAPDVRADAWLLWDVARMHYEQESFPDDRSKAA